MRKEMSCADLSVEAITRRVVEDLEKGVAPWEKPWFHIPPVNGASGKAYRGINYVQLAIMRDDFKFSSNIWVTFKQVEKLNGKVKKGSKGFKIFYYEAKEKASVNQETGKMEVNMFFILKFATVFNIDQTEGLDGLRVKYPHPNKIVLSEEAQNLIAASRASIIHVSTERACFYPATDEIILPAIESFKSEYSYFSTAYHELTHWSGAKSRLNRDFSGRFGSEAYAFEELVAELGASLLCAHMGFPYSNQHSAYIASWITVLKNDTKALFTAGSKAQQAVDYLLKLKNETSLREVA